MLCSVDLLTDALVIHASMHAQIGLAVFARMYASMYPGMCLHAHSDACMLHAGN